MQRELSCPNCQALIHLAAPPLSGSSVVCPACGHKFAAAGSPPPLAHGAAPPPVPPRAATPPSIVAPPKLPRPPVPSQPATAPPLPAQVPASAPPPAAVTFALPPLAAVAPGGPPPLAAAPSRATRVIFALAAVVLLTASGITAAVLLTQDNDDETSEKQDSGKPRWEQTKDGDDDGGASGGNSQASNPGGNGGNAGGQNNSGGAGGGSPGMKPPAAPDGDWETRQTLLFSAEDAVTNFIPGSLRVSPDGRRYAYALKNGDVTHWIVDGKQVGNFTSVDATCFVFSQDGKHYLCAGDSANNYLIFMDGRQLTDEVYKGYPPTLYLSANGKHHAYFGWIGNYQQFMLDGDMIYQHGLTFPGTQFTAYGQPQVTASDKLHWAVNGTNQALIDGKLFTSGGEIKYVTFSERGDSFGYITSQDNQSLAVINGKPQKRHDSIASALFFSPDGKRFAHTAVHAGKNYIVVDNERFETAEQPSLFKFSPDSRRWACVSTTPGKDYYDPAKVRVMVDGAEGPAYGAISCLAFSADSQHLDYAATRWSIPSAPDPPTKPAILVRDEQELGEFGRIGESLIGSPDSRHVACLAGDSAEGETFVAVNGKQAGPAFVTALPPQFSPDSNIVGCVARNDDLWYAVLDGEARGGCDSIGPENSRVGFTPEGTYTYVAVRDGAYYWVEERRK